MGQQVLEAGLATQKGYAPLDSQIYVSKKKVLDAKVSFKDKRSAVARDYEVTKKDNKKINGLSFSQQILNCRPQKYSKSTLYAGESKSISRK
jgi:hypothetical protein